ncbi:XRE family transcriptional regulator [Streptomyces platensis]|uniref:HTH-type transcriptional regulator PuuR n=1 Tax=Streptomyces platensis TaxID=58346 RepID=A0AAE6TT80_STRPT|nr:helix-turn-helix transcriptional regulator [Streptomyces platensis]OSY48503.1 HTH-type transcriptional regulator PuuR [Streptomyces platensis]QEV55893.1 XRE family transcriptional regulator [Streptomyces platensis]
MTMQVGSKIRAARLARGLSLNELSSLASVAKATLAQLERGQGNPTLETLTSLATHLGMSLPELFSAADTPDPQVTRAGEGLVIRDDGLALRLVHSATGERALYEIFDLRLAEGAYESGSHGEGVLEHLIVHDGEMLVGPHEGRVHLRPGDFISFSANCPHSYESLHGETRATLVVFYPARVPDRR